MLIHSIISPVDIFYNADTFKAPVCRSINGGFVELDGNRIRRLISTDPKMYLDSRYFPYSRFG